jgi:STE24 endopeptidase
LGRHSQALFDPAAATAAYLAQLPPEAHAKATAYTQGGHWLLLWGFLVAVLVSFLIVRSGVLVGLRRRLERRKPRPLLVSLVVGVVYLLIDWRAEPALVGLFRLVAAEGSTA